MNTVVLSGRLGRDPELSYTPQTQTACCKFSLAVDRRFKQDGGQDADFISCVAFGKTAEFIDKYIYKGMKIALEGRIQTGSYTNKDNVKIYTTDVVVEAVEFAESKKQDNNDGAGFEEIDLNDDDLPFLT